jgi:hypothetical protein
MFVAAVRESVLFCFSIFVIFKLNVLATMSVDVEITFTRVYRLFYFPFIMQKPAVG